MTFNGGRRLAGCWSAGVLFYSVCGTGKPDYHLEMMTARDDSNLLDANSWTNNGVQFETEDQNGVYGPGNNGFITFGKGTE